MSHNSRTIDISLVTHRHGDLLLSALEALKCSIHHNGPPVSVWLTFNIPEPALQTEVESRRWPFQLRLIHNPVPLGFGANHNQAFAASQNDGAGPWFMVMNPDIFLPVDSTAFWRSLQDDLWPVDVGLLCPRQVDAQNRPQDYARQLMLPWSVARRVLRRVFMLAPNGVASSVESADWVNGACMVWRREAFAALKGFDERFFMYCEDADICLRLQLSGWRMQGVKLSVVHDARRNTGRSLKHLAWHVRSMFRLWCSSSFWRYILRQRMK